MPDQNSPSFLLASPEPALLSRVEPVLQAMGGRVEVVLSGEAALTRMVAADAPALALLDAKLPGVPMEQLLAAAQIDDGIRGGGIRFPIVLIADRVTREWFDRVREGVVDDVILRGAFQDYWRLRIERALYHGRQMRELRTLRESAAANAQFDRLTCVYNREALLSILFRETDRAQRMDNSLSLVLLDIDDFGHWNARLGSETCDELLRQVVARTARLLRSYDVLGRPGKDEFLLLLPGCGMDNAMMLAERLRLDVFSAPFRVRGGAIRLSACFGLALSRGRSPVVVLREAEQALELARQTGAETIQCYGDSNRPYPPPVTFLSPSSGDELLAW